MKIWSLGMPLNSQIRRSSLNGIRRDEKTITIWIIFKKGRVWVEFEV